MPRMKAFDCPKFSTDESIDVNLTADGAGILNIDGIKNAVNDQLDEVNSQLKETHLGHEAHLWGQSTEGMIE